MAKLNAEELRKRLQKHPDEPLIEAAMEAAMHYGAGNPTAFAGSSNEHFEAVLYGDGRRPGSKPANDNGRVRKTTNAKPLRQPERPPVEKSEEDPSVAPSAVEPPAV